eukprot:15477006-Alexandrium_andersonii.AAC.1
MGFPVNATAAEACGTSCHMARDAPNVPVTRSHRSQTHQIGNAMHVNSVGSILLLVALKFPMLGEKFGQKSSEASKEKCKTDGADAERSCGSGGSSLDSPVPPVGVNSSPAMPFKKPSASFENTDKKSA